MRTSRVVVAGVLAVFLAACSITGEADDDQTDPPPVTVLGTTVDSDAPVPTLGSAVSTERG
jgi:hypothetical protein